MGNRGDHPVFRGGMGPFYDEGSPAGGRDTIFWAASNPGAAPAGGLCRLPGVPEAEAAADEGPGGSDEHRRFVRPGPEEGRSGLFQIF